MIKAQQFLIDHINSKKDSYDAVEERSGVSKSTVSRMMKGQTVSTTSMRLIADSYDKLDEFLALISASADPSRVADELHERFEHAERLLTEGYEERIRSLNAHIKTLRESNEESKAHYERQLDRMDKVHEKERELDERHFGKEREALEKTIDTQNESILRLRRNNLYCVIALCVEAVTIMLVSAALLMP